MMPFWIIYDGIACLPTDAKYVESVIKEETLKATGLNATVKTEPWDESTSVSHKIKRKNQKKPTKDYMKVLEML